jgi:hypothetical protein
MVGIAGVVILSALLVVQVTKDLAAPVDAWYFRSTWTWLIVMALGSTIFLANWRSLARAGDVRAIFRRLPPQ